LIDEKSFLAVSNQNQTPIDVEWNVSFLSTVSVFMSILSDPSWIRQPEDVKGIIPFGIYTPFLILSIS
jgi:hypothetical protein